MKYSEFITSTAVLAILCTSTVAANADQLQGGVSRTKAQSGVGSYLKTHPKVKDGIIGTGAGAGVGAVTGLISGKGIMRGAGIGAGTGAAVGVIQGSQFGKRHTYVKNGAIGTIAGAGLGMAASRGHGTGKKSLEVGALGGALGLGATFLEKKLK